MILEKKEKKFYTSYSKLSEIKLITIGLASPERIKQWAEKTLPNGKILGEVINANTLHHKTFKPQKGGLFCERIFGPLKDFECACGKPLKYKKEIISRELNSSLKGKENIKKVIESNPNKAILGEIVTKTRNFCPICEVEYTWSVMRRYQLGYIKLTSPVTHVWYLKGNPSYLSILLDIKKRHLEYITYCSETLTIENALKGGLASLKSSDIISSWKKLKNQILIEKKVNITKKNEIKQIFVNKKIEKRSLIPLKKLLVNKFFYKKNSYRNLEKNNFKDWYEFLNSFKIQLKQSLNQIKKQDLKISQNFIYELISQKKIKSYAYKLNFKNLKILSFIITQIKQTKIQNNRDFFNMQNSNEFWPLISFKIKKLSIPYYILLNLNISSQKSINKNITNIAWKKLSEKALHIAFNKIIKIFNKYDSLSIKDKWLENFINMDILTSTLIKNKKTKTTTIMYGYYQAMVNAINEYKNIVNNKSILTTQTSLDGDKIILILRDSIKSIKNYFFCLMDYKKEPWFSFTTKASPSISKLNFSNKNDLLISAENKKFQEERLITNTAIISENQQILNNSLILKNKKRFLLKSHFYLELYTLLNFPNELGNFVISNFLIKPMFNIKSYKNCYKIIINNLSKIFFNLFLKNISNKGAIEMRYTKYNLKTLLNLNYFKEERDEVQIKKRVINLNKTKLTEILNIKNLINLKEFKKSLSFLYLLGNIKNLNYKSGDEIFFDNYSKLFENKKLNNKIYPEISAKDNLTFNIFIKILENNLIRKKSNNYNKLILLTFPEVKVNSTFTKKLYNNFYCLSHRERWESENDWNFFYYFMTAQKQNENDPLLSNTKIKPIPNYINRYSNLLSRYETNFFSQEIPSLNSSNKINFSSNFQEKLNFFDEQKSSNYSGPGILQHLLNEFNFYEIKKIDKQNRILLYQLNKQIYKLKKSGSYYKRDRSSKKELKESFKKRDLLIRRTKLIRKLFIKESSPQATILTVLPVLPPDLRPIVKMGGQIAASDLNRLYQRVIYRNDRLKKFLKDPATSYSYEMKYAQRLLQEAVDNLIQNGKSGVTFEKDSRGRALKSLSDILKGKQGRFRQYLLGKRVDYSGRSVIVVGPKLKLHECGIPKEMALELYLPFLLKRILNEKLSRTVVGAKTLIKTNPSLIWELLREIMQTCPVLLNRAPTLHRLGIQAFQPKLIDGRAILLHPLVCSAFNADFDGDQMAVHVPITVEARAEAWKLMLSRNNILSPATGDPLAIPSQDMVLGCYYLTTNLLNCKTQSFAHKKGSGFYYSKIEDVLKDYQLQEIDLHANIWLKWDGFIENGSDQEEPIEIRINSFGNWQEIYNKKQNSYNSKNKRFIQYILTTPGKILFNEIIKKSLNLKKV